MKTRHSIPFLPFFASLWLLFSSHVLTAQWQRGDWLIEGRSYFLNVERRHLHYKTSHETETVFGFSTQLGVAIKDRWMLGAALGLGIRRNEGWLYNQLFAQYVFLQKEELELFTGLSFEWHQSAYFSKNTPSRERNFSDVGEIQSGVRYWLNPGIAVEGTLRFQFFYHGYSSQFQREPLVGAYAFFISPRYYVRPVSKGTTVLPDSRLFWSKGRRLLHFYLMLKNNSIFVDPLHPQDLLTIQMEQGWFLRDRFLLAAALRFAKPDITYRSFYVDFFPYVRYYFPLKHSRSFWVQLGSRYNGQKISGKILSAFEGVVGLAYSKIINPHLSLELKGLTFLPLNIYSINVVNTEVTLGLQYSWKKDGN